MRVGFQHMGNLSIALKAFIQGLGCEVALGPRPNKRTLEAGVKHAPEGVCLPFKVTLGDMFGALDRGVDTLLFIGGGDWSCRYGYYGRVQCLILRKLGYRFRDVYISGENTKSVISQILHLAQGSWTFALARFGHAFALAWHKSRLVEQAESLARKARPVETKKGEASRTLRKCLGWIERADTLKALRSLKHAVREEFASLPKEPEARPLRVQIVGESYCVVEPFVNFDLIEHLGHQGVLAEPFLTAHRWLFRHALKKEEDREFPRERAEELARPVWAYCTGGEDRAGIGHAIHAAQEGFDGIVHLMPFSCMPETAALPAFERVAATHDIPFLNFSLDEHTGAAGVYTRVEAFLDFLHQRRQKRNPPLAVRRSA